LKKTRQQTINVPLSYSTPPQAEDQSNSTLFQQQPSNAIFYTLGTDGSFSQLQMSGQVKEVAEVGVQCNIINGNAILYTTPLF